MSIAEQTIAAIAPDQSHDRLLAVRRVDWRFLLRDPNLRDVACVGAVPGSLFQALRQVSESLTRLDTRSSSSQHDAQYDVVVCCNPPVQVLDQATQWVARHGALYVEIQRRRPRTPHDAKAPPTQTRRRQPGRFWPCRWPAIDVAQVLRLHGFADLETYWHWPDFEACAEIVPLHHKHALLESLARRHSGAAAQLKAAGVRALMGLGLLHRVVPCFSIVAYRTRQK